MNSSPCVIPITPLSVLQERMGSAEGISRPHGSQNFTVKGPALPIAAFFVRHAQANQKEKRQSGVWDLASG